MCRQSVSMRFNSLNLNASVVVVEIMRLAECELLGQGFRNGPTGRIRSSLSMSSKLSNLWNPRWKRLRFPYSWLLCQGVRNSPSYESDIQGDRDGPTGHVGTCASRRRKRLDWPLRIVMSPIRLYESEFVHQSVRNAMNSRTGTSWSYCLNGPTGPTWRCPSTRT